MGVTTGPNPPIPTQDSDVGGTLTPPAQAPVTPPMQLQPAQQPTVTTPAVPPSSNPKLHGFIGSVLSGTLKALAGRPATKYITDADGRVVPAPVQPQDTNADRGRRLAAHALEGLAAGASVPQQKSGAASALAGLGAGASAATASAKAQDEKARQQERENAEAAEQKKLRMHEIARGNALTASTWQHMMESEQDRDPARQQHLDWAKSAEAAGIPVKYVSEDEANQIRQSDPEAAAKFQILPVGMKMVTDEQGQPVLDESGKPKMTGQFALIDGLHDGNIPAPASFVSDLAKYGKYAGVDGGTLKPGDDLSMQHFIKLSNAIQEGKKKEIQGWEKPELGWKDGQPIQINSNDPSQMRPFAPGVTPNVENKPEDTAAQKALREAQAQEAKAKSQEALANAALLSQQLKLGGNNDAKVLNDYAAAIKNLPPEAQGILKAVPPNVQLSLLAVAAGDADLAKTFPTRTTAKSGQLDAAHATTLVKLLNPDWNAQYFKAVQEATDDMTKSGGKGHEAVKSFGQFLEHADEARRMSNDLIRTNSPLLNEPINDLKKRMLGDPAVNNLLTAIFAARSEWNTFIHNGHAPTKEEVDTTSTLMNDASNVATINGVLGVMGDQAIGRLDQVNEGYKTITHRDWPNLVPPDAKQAAINLGLGEKIKKYGSGGTLRGAMNVPPQLTNLHSNGNVTIGWDGKQWVDSKTMQPYQAPAAGAQ